MNKIWKEILFKKNSKFTLGESGTDTEVNGISHGTSFVVELPAYSRIISFGLDLQGNSCIWFSFNYGYEMDDEIEKRPYRVWVVKTGLPFPEGLDPAAQYLGQHHDQHHGSIWHFYIELV